jgi:hypothetical protein
METGDSDHQHLSMPLERNLMQEIMGVDVQLAHMILLLLARIA